MRRLLVLAAALYLLALLADGAVSLLDGAARLWGHTGALGPPHAALGFVVAAGSFCLYVAGGLSRALPWRRYGAAVVFPFVAGLVVTPLAMPLASELSIAEMVGQRPEVLAAKAPGLLYAGMLVGALQVALAALTIRAVRRATPGGALVPPAGAAEAPGARPFTWRWGLGFAAANLVLLVVAGPVFLALTAMTTLDALGRGYIACDTSGIALVQKDLVREGKTVSLVGMMHVGEESFYRDLVDSIDPEGTVLLAEGVSDRAQLMKHPMQYREVAAAVGLSPQAAVFAPQQRGLEVVHADVDMASFAPSTVEALNAMAEVHSGQAKDVGAILRLQMRMSDPAMLERLFQDIVDARNAHLLEEIDRALPSHERVVVPWGALHLRDIEKALLAKGFTISATQRRTIVRFATVREKLANGG